MKTYDLSNQLDLASFSARVEGLKKSAEKRRVIVEIGEKTQRTLNQNSYLHLILSYFACEIGLTLDYVKRQYFKATVNPELFVCEKYDTLIDKRVKYLRSSSALDKDEMSLAISRFVEWAAQEANIYLPSPDDKAMLLECEITVNKNKKYL